MRRASLHCAARGTRSTACETGHGTNFITGEFRIGVSARSVVRALATLTGIDSAVIAHRLAGHWQPSAPNYLALISTHGEQGASSRPYPLFLAHPLDGDPATLGGIDDWQIEWKWDGIRAQLIRRQDEVFLWSRGDALINDAFPDLVAPAGLTDGTVIDGEIVWQRQSPLSTSCKNARA